jgi:tRNA(Ile)-lysidine synthase
MHASDPSGLPEHFARQMDRLDPFEPRPRIAVAVSGGADSMALCLLAHDWARPRNGEIVALTVDHGLRPCSAAEADATLVQLAALGVPGRKLSVTGLCPGPALAERAREARYRLLLDACAAAGIAHLLLAHHRGDQVETVMTRALSGSASIGLAGMAALRETNFVRLLRPLLDVPPWRLRGYLTARGVAWIEDPSNHDPAARRARLRMGRDDPAGTGEGTLAVAEAARRAGIARAGRGRAIARILARRASFHPEAYARITPGPIDPEALSALLRAIAGAPFAPPIDRVAALARDPRPATIGGVRVMAAGRLGPGWLLVRERRAMEAPVAARRGAVWDGRFRLVAAPPGVLPPADDSSRAGHARPTGIAADLTLGALDADARTLRNRTTLPAAILHALPAVRLDGEILAVPHIGLGDPRWRIVFDPRNRAAGAPFPPG